MTDCHHEYCTFTLGDQLCGVEVIRVQEVVREQALTPVPLAPDYVAGLLNLRGQIVTTIDLRRRIASHGALARRPTHLVVRDSEGAISLLVDAPGEVISVPATSFEPCPDTVRSLGREFIRGVHKLDHHLLLVLDLGRILAVTRADQPQENVS